MTLYVVSIWSFWTYCNECRSIFLSPVSAERNATSESKFAFPKGSQSFFYNTFGIKHFSPSHTSLTSVSSRSISMQNQKTIASKPFVVGASACTEDEMASEEISPHEIDNVEIVKNTPDSSITHRIQGAAKLRSKLHSCNACGKRYSNKKYSELHRCHKDKPKPARSLMCTVCGKLFVDNRQLKHHSLIHTGERPAECEICKKTFRQCGTLRRHVQSVHLGNRSHVCAQCGKGFKRLAHLKEHWRI